MPDVLLKRHPRLCMYVVQTIQPVKCGYSRHVKIGNNSLAKQTRLRSEANSKQRV